MLRAQIKPVLLRAYRAGVLMTIAWLIHQHHAQFSVRNASALTVAQVRRYFPEVASLSAVDYQNGTQRVLDAKGGTLGFVAQTAPLSDKIIGYAGPTNALIIFSEHATVRFVDILHSDDTPEHVVKVEADRSFRTAFKRLKVGNVTEPPKIDAVSGATLTSAAIAEGVMRRLGQSMPSMRFPDELDLKEVRKVLPEARSLESSKRHAGFLEVRDRKGTLIGHAGRTSPASDGISGYSGPSDLLVILNREGTRLEAFRMRKTYDTPDYVASVTTDKYFMNLFNGMELRKLATLDLEKDLIEGVSGATKTSWGFAESLRERARSLLEEHDAGSSRFVIKPLKAADWGLFGILVLSLTMAFTPLRGKRWARWSHQALLIGYAGYYSAAMLSQGLLAGWAKHGVPWQSAPILVLLTALALALPLFTRHQFYCHHYCPHGALQQWLAHRLPRQLHVPPRIGRWLERIPAALLVFIIISVMFGWNVNLNALEPFDAWLIRIAGWGSIFVALAGLISSLFVPMSYCRYGCPTGALLKFMRFAGRSDHFGKRDAVALGLVLVVAVLHFAR